MKKIYLFAYLMGFFTTFNLYSMESSFGISKFDFSNNNEDRDLRRAIKLSLEDESRRSLSRSYSTIFDNPTALSDDTLRVFTRSAGSLGSECGHMVHAGVLEVKSRMPVSLISEVPVLYPRVRKQIVDGCTYSFDITPIYHNPITHKAITDFFYADASASTDIEIFHNDSTLPVSIKQIRTVDQFKGDSDVGAPVARCAALALRNVLLELKLAQEEDKGAVIAEFANEDKAADFINHNAAKIEEWTDTKSIAETVENIVVEYGQNPKDILLLDGVLQLDNRVNFIYADDGQLSAINNRLDHFKNRLKQKNYCLGIVFGDNERQESGGHFAAASLIKKDDTVQLLVADTEPENYHLAPGSLEMLRLQHMLECIYNDTSECLSLPTEVVGLIS